MGKLIRYYFKFMAWWDGLNEWTKTIPDILSGFKNKIKRKIKNFFLRLRINCKTKFLKFINWFPERWIGKKLKIFIEITIYNFSFALFIGFIRALSRLVGFDPIAKYKQKIVHFRDGKPEWIHSIERFVPDRDNEAPTPYRENRKLFWILLLIAYLHFPSSG